MPSVWEHVFPFIPFQFILSPDITIKHLGKDVPCDTFCVVKKNGGQWKYGGQGANVKWNKKQKINVNILQNFKIVLRFQQPITI